MARELKLVTWCDGEHDGDVPATTARTLAVDGSKPILLDLCETCDKVVQDMLAFMDRGVLASHAVSAPAARVRRSPGSVPLTPPQRRDGKDRADCMEEGCGYVGRTRSALGQHLKSKHGTKFTDYDWTPQ